MGSLDCLGCGCADGWLWICSVFDLRVVMITIRLFGVIVGGVMPCLFASRFA